MHIQVHMNTGLLFEGGKGEENEKAGQSVVCTGTSKSSREWILKTGMLQHAGPQSSFYNSIV